MSAPTASNKLRALAYFTVGLLATALWDGAFLVSRKVGVFDWYKERYYLEYALDAIRQWRTLPVSFVAFWNLKPPDVSVHSALDAFPAIRHSASYWGNPEVLTFSPFLAFAFLPGIAFVKLYIALHFLVALAGVFLLARRAGLSAWWAFGLYLLTFLNPWLMQHIAIGYTPHITACWVPLVVACLLEKRRVVLGTLLAAGVNALIIYEGGLHIFIWFNLAVAVFAVASMGRRRARAVFSRVAGLWGFTLLLAAPKLYAGHAAFGGWTRAVGVSYASFADLWALFTEQPTPHFGLPMGRRFHGTSPYDGPIFVGRAFVIVLALAVLLYLARAVRPFLRRERHDDRGEGRLLVVAGVFVALGWNGVWTRLVAAMPMLGCEVYPYRFLIVSIVAASFFIVRELARFTVRRPVRQLAVAVAFAFIAQATHARNRYFVEIATSQLDPLNALSAETALAKATAKTYGLNASGRRVAIKVVATPSEVVLKLERGTRTVILPWITNDKLRDFDVRGATIAVAKGRHATLATATDSVKRVRLVARAYSRGALVYLGFSAYAVLLLVALVRARTVRRAAQRAW